MNAPMTKARSFRTIRVGDPAPWFEQRSTTRPLFAFDTSAGRYVVMCFLASAGDPAGRAVLEAVERNRSMFDDQRMSFFGVSIDPRDETSGRVVGSLPGVRFFWDFDASVSRAYGAVPQEAGESGKTAAQRFWLVLDPTLRVMARFPIGSASQAELEAVFGYLRQLPPQDSFAGFEMPPPILVLPNVFEPELCRLLIDEYEREGGEETGFMTEADGKTVAIHDHRQKRRRDHTIADPDLVTTIQNRFKRRVIPDIKRIFWFDATRMERYIVGCYAAEDNAHFRAHRDNTTKGTAHRRFAVSINLNGDFAGGELSFPEYGARSYKAPPGGAVVFPCVLLHAVSQVTQGRRYAFLPFLYDEAAAKVREANNQFVGAGGQYQA